MRLKKKEPRFEAALLGALGLPEYFIISALVRQDGQTGISRLTLLTQEQEVRVKSALTNVINAVVSMQNKNISRLRSTKQENEKLKAVVAESIRKGEIKLSPNQLEVLAFIRRNLGNTVKRNAYLFAKDDEEKKVRFLITVHSLEMSKLVRLRQSGVEKIPEVTKEGNSHLASYKDPLSRAKRPASTNDWRDLALAVIMDHQSGNNYSLERLVRDAKRYATGYNFDLSGMGDNFIHNSLVSGVVDLKNTNDVVVTRIGDKENIALKEPDLTTPVSEILPPVDSSVSKQETDDLVEREENIDSEDSMDEEDFSDSKALSRDVARVDQIIKEALDGS